MSKIVLSMVIAASALAAVMSGMGGSSEEPRVEPSRSTAARGAATATTERAAAVTPAAERVPPPPAAKAAITTLKQALRSEEHETQYRAIDALAAVLRADPDAIPPVVDVWRRRIGTPLGEAMCVALGLVPDPRITAAALDLADSDGTTVERLAGFELLDRIDPTDSATVRSLVELLGRERDPRMRSAALYDLGAASPDPMVRAEVRTALVDAMGDGDSEVRRRAVMAMADWTDADADLESVVAALGDSSQLVRSAAAFAIGRSPHASPEMRARVAAIAADGEQEWPLRIVARSTLGSDSAFAEQIRRFEEDDAAYRAQMPADQAAGAE